MLRHTQWVQKMTMECGADIRLNTEATPEMVMAENPDAVIVAVGSSPVKPRIPGIDNDNVYSGLDVDSGRKKVSGKVVVCGGGISGCESALGLAMEGCDVTIVDMIPADNFAPGMAMITRNMLLMLLEENNVKLVGDHLVRSIEADGVHAEGRDWKMDVFEADYVVDAFGMRANSAVAEQFADLVPETFIVGDCDGVKNLDKANRTAYYAACNI